jgi:hypothetical protein
MNFSDVLSDIEKLKNKKLPSIRKGAEITIEEVDRTNDRLLLTTVGGKKRSRPLSEIRTLWERLCASAALHVDSALGGSGSSRNQPETILANLPYIEWLSYEGKKHLTLMGRDTHVLGTLRQMDGEEAERVKKRLREGIGTTSLSTIIVVASDVKEAAANLENITGLKVESIESGVYKRDHSGSRIFIVAQSSLQSLVEPGTYAVISGTSIPQNSRPIRLGGHTLYPVIKGGMNIMVLEPEVPSLLL